ncbi:MAG: hypothetical protein NTY07_16250 [Bacteroidia bacterium]|nr:hypothetical protein [Bacteroidia bacterium]
MLGRIKSAIHRERMTNSRKFLLPLIIEIIIRKFSYKAIEQFRSISKNGIFFRESEISMCSLFPKSVLDLIIEKYNPKSILDVGCGTDQSLSYFI